ncbi:MAG: hypothetical protein ACLQIQ_09220 [Beijerinckiaceae bacterium]
MSEEPSPDRRATARPDVGRQEFPQFRRRRKGFRGAQDLERRAAVTGDQSIQMEEQTFGTLLGQQVIFDEDGRPLCDRAADDVL